MVTEVYSQAQIRAILRGMNISIKSETATDFLTLCPFHNNKTTPSFAISYAKGLYVCFNPSCNVTGTILDLVKQITHRNDYEALRFIASVQEETAKNFDEELAEILEDKPEFDTFDQATLDKLYNDILTSEPAKEYLFNRGINQESIDYFKIGYSTKNNMIAVPVHSPDGLPVGIVGRSIEGKAFKNSRNLPRNKTMFNIHRAKRSSATVIVCESSFDAIRIHQSGFPNVVATLGGFISRENLNNLNRFFTKIIIMTDFDNKEEHIAENCRKCYPDSCKGHNPGRDLGYQIATVLKNKDISWACYDYNVVYPHNAKDVGDMTEQEIKQCIVNAVPHFEYTTWNIY